MHSLRDSVRRYFLVLFFNSLEIIENIVAKRTGFWVPETVYQKMCSAATPCYVIFSLFSSVTSGFSTWQTWPGCAPAVQHHSLQPVTFEGWKWSSITLWKGGDARLMWLWGAGFSTKSPQAVCSDCRDTPDLLQIFGLGLLRCLKFLFRKGSRFDGTRDKQSNSKAWHHILCCNFLQWFLVWYPDALEGNQTSSKACSGWGDKYLARFVIVDARPSTQCVFFCDQCLQQSEGDLPERLWQSGFRGARKQMLETVMPTQLRAAGTLVHSMNCNQ